MSTAELVFRPMFVRPTAIVMLEANAHRDTGIAFEAPGRAEIAFSLDSAEFDDDEYVVTTSYEISLLNTEREVVAKLGTTYLISFTADISAKELTDESSRASLQMAASEVIHPYHRELLTQLSERFDIPAYRLDFAFDRELFAANFKKLELEDVE